MTTPDVNRSEAQGYHQFIAGDGETPHGSFEIFWHAGDAENERGWYWWACFPGCLPDGEDMIGPFNTSVEAKNDAEEI